MSDFIPGVSKGSSGSCGSGRDAADHLVHFYEGDDDLLDRLTSFSGEALRAGDSTIVIGTPVHLDALQWRLHASGIDLSRAILEDRYIRLDAETTLARFMVGGRPDRTLFQQSLARLLHRARVHGRGIRAFGEMVALLWERGEAAAALELERLWNELIAENPMTLLCMYPWRVLERDFASVSRICAEHRGASGMDQRLSA